MALLAAPKSTPERLTTLLEQMLRREEVTPDSFFYDVALLRRSIDEQQDSTAKALYRAVLAHRLVQNAWRSQSRSRNTESSADSIQEWSRE